MNLSISYNISTLFFPPFNFIHFTNFSFLFVKSRFLIYVCIQNIRFHDFLKDTRLCRFTAHVQDGAAHWQRDDGKDFSGQIYRSLQRQRILYEKNLRVALWQTLLRCREEDPFPKIGRYFPSFFQLSQIDILFSNRFLILLFYSLTVPCICRSVLRYSVGCPKSVRGRYDASFVLYDSSTPSIIIGRSACHASQRRFEMGANVCLSNFRTIYIHVRETIYRSNL